MLDLVFTRELKLAILIAPIEPQASLRQRLAEKLRSPGRMVMKTLASRVEQVVNLRPIGNRPPRVRTNLLDRQQGAIRLRSHPQKGV